MKLIKENQTRIIPIKISKYNTFFKRLKGLSFKLKPINHEGILLTPCNSIHMFFMFFEIDIVFLNKNNQVIYYKENVKPWKIIFPVKQAVSALELPASFIRQHQINIGDFIDFENE